VQTGSWRWAFWINVPLALATLAITFSKVPESRDPHHSGLDLHGAACATLGLAGLVFGLLEGPRLGFTHPAVIVALAAGTISLAAFIPVERRVRSPMLPLDIFRSRTFSGTNLITLLLYAALGAELYFLPFNLIQVHRYTPAQAGAALLPLIVLMTLLSGQSGKLADRFGPRPSLVAGPLIAAAGYTLLALPGVGGSYWKTFFPPVTVLGLGMAVTVAPLTTTVMGSAGRAQAGVASGINNAVSRIASLLAIAVFGIVAYHRFAAALARRLPSLGLPSEARRQLSREQGKLAAATIPASLPPRLRSAVGATIAGSFVEAFQLLSLVAAGLAIAASFTAWLFIRNGPPTDRH
jgi:predicted MFS family arabinose efflux permease